jgi:hypothetical protein
MTQQALTIRQDQTLSASELTTKDILAYLCRTQGHHETRAQWGVELALLPSLITLEKPRVIFLYIALQTHPHHPGLVPFLEDFRMVHTQPVPEGYLGLDAAWHVRTTAFITSHVIHLLLSIQLSRELLSSLTAKGYVVYLRKAAMKACWGNSAKSSGDRVLRSM